MKLGYHYDIISGYEMAVEWVCRYKESYLKSPHHVSILIASFSVFTYLGYFSLRLFSPPSILCTSFAFNNSFHSIVPTFINKAPQCK